jgi:hypothetical protein
MSTKKTGWEALDKWVGDSPASTPAPAGGAKKTGWEALDKWVGDNGAPTEAGPAASSGGAKSSGGGFWDKLKAFFSGK